MRSKTNRVSNLSLAMPDKACLHFPGLSCPIIVQTGASTYDLGVVLLQKYDSILRPITVANHTLIGAERNDSTTENECLVNFVALKTIGIYTLTAHRLTFKLTTCLSLGSKGFKTLQNSSLKGLFQLSSTTLLSSTSAKLLTTL